jgi:hypothetical protein
VETVVLPARTDGSPLPMRPILLGGDDVAVIIRADLATRFAQVFSHAFEAECAATLGAFARSPGALTASVGLVYFGRRQPIAQIQSLTYELLKGVAKKEIKRAVSHGAPVPAAMAWHSLTVSEISDLESLISHDWTCSTPWGEVRVAGLPYVIGCSELPGIGSLESMLTLRDELTKAPSTGNRLREILGLLPVDAAAAVFRYRRWREVDAASVERVRALLSSVFGGALEAHQDLPLLFKRPEGGWVTPIGDLLALMAAEATA